MSPRNAIIFTVLIAILLPYYYYVDRPELRIKELTTSVQESLFDLPGGIDALTVSRDNEKVRYTRRSDGQYKVVRAGRQVCPAGSHAGPGGPVRGRQVSGSGFH